MGEICCRGPAVFAGYHGNPEATALRRCNGGWFHTGDLGRLDARGLLFITGRQSDMYISGGANVYPREVEDVLMTHPGVADVAVLGVPDATWGEIGVAVVVRRRGCTVAGRGGRRPCCSTWRAAWREVPLAAASGVLGRAAHVRPTARSAKNDVRQTAR